MRRLLVAVPAAVLGPLLMATTGCGLTIPTDPHGTLDRVRSEQVLRAGASPSDGWVEVDADDPAGREVELVEGFAESLGARVEWTVGGEEELVGDLEDGRLDLLVGGFTDQSPWMDKAALTRPYVEVTVDGEKEAHVMLVRLGENALQSALEEWLDQEGPL
jgi:ABC-type amino acid transport substrate-binding protein